jgi:hypothetical protein
VILRTNFNGLTDKVFFPVALQKHRPSPIALEPCVGNRAAVLSLIVRLPTGGKLYTPNGYTGIAVASSLVTLGNYICGVNTVKGKPNYAGPKM